MAMRTVMAGVLAAGAAVLLGAAPAARPAAKAEGDFARNYGFRS